MSISGFIMSAPCVLVALLFAVASSAMAGERHYKVQGPANPKAWENTAVKELEHYLDVRLGGNRLTVEGQDGVVFHVGDTVFAKQNGLVGFKDEEWCVKSFGGNVAIVGGGTRGTLYAVYHFLEDECGVRWWMDGDEDVPPAGPLSFVALDRRGKPFFICRNIWRFKTSDPRTAVRNRLNDNGDSLIPPELGGAFTYGPPSHAHTWDMYLPFAKYGKEHPEWYSLVGGKRIGGHWDGQLCLTCPGLVDEFSRRLEDFIAKGEADAAARGVPAPRIYDISMNDSRSYCQCTNCAAATEMYGHSGLQVKFVNAIAERAAVKHPDLFFSMLAYYYSEELPSEGVRAADNVIVRFCNTRQNLAAGIFDKDNHLIHDLVKDWNKFAKNLFVWEYGITYETDGKGMGCPFPSEPFIFEKFRFYADNGVKGFLLEHEHPECSDMYELKYRLECKAMEDPYQNPEPLVEDFYNRYYGVAAEKVREARSLLARCCRERKAFVPWFPTMGEFNFLTDDDLAEFERIFGEASALVKGDQKLERRVERAFGSIRRLAPYLADIRRRIGAKHPPENGVSDTPFYEIRCGDEEICSILDAENIDRVKDPDLGDPEAGGETVVRVKVTPTPDSYYTLPFLMGIYNTADKIDIAPRQWGRPHGTGYHWYSLGRVTLPERNFCLYLTRKWTVQLPFSLPEMNGRTFEAKALVKFTGPSFFEGSTEPDEIRIARVVYAEP